MRPADGDVGIGTDAADPILGFEVSDSGPGIPLAERSAVLRRFHRAEKSRHTPGCGLGLSLVAAVAKLHGLTLAIEDVGPGCRVRLWREQAAHPPRQPELEGSVQGIR
jgi:signal transduction histidine kinase